MPTSGAKRVAVKRPLTCLDCAHCRVKKDGDGEGYVLRCAQEQWKDSRGRVKTMSAAGLPVPFKLFYAEQAVGCTVSELAD